MPTAPGSSRRNSLDYENPNIPEGINVTAVHPLKDFALLALGVLGTVVLLVIIVSLSAEYVARFVPFGFEQKLVSKFESMILMGEAPTTDESQAIQTYLESLTQRIAAVQELPAGMTVTVHYRDDETVNAYATLGGHIIVFRGLLERMPHENALAMVIAHEIAHIKHRDPIVAFGRGLTISVALASLIGVADSGPLERLLIQTGTLTALKFNRSQEEAADDEGLRALLETYGHVHGAETLFEVLAQETADGPPAFFSTHPLNEDRITKIKSLADNREPVEFTALPRFVEPPKSAN